MDALTVRVLALRETSAAASLRRGGSPSTERYAYPYLAFFWVGKASWSREATLRYAALASSLPRAPHKEGVTLGEVLARDVLSGALGEAGVSRRLGMTQSGDLEQLHRLLRGLLTSSRAVEKGLDWDLIRKIYFSWDSPNLEWRAKARRRFLEEFYQARSGLEPAPSDAEGTTAGQE